MAAGAGMQLGALNHARSLGAALITIKHLLMPVVATLVAVAFGLNPVQTTILLMFAALPTASSCYVLAARMGYDGPYVAALVTVSTVAGMFSLPLALGVLRAAAG
jgi:malonate transporter